MRRSRRPFQVSCVLVAVLLAAALSLHFVSAERAGGRPVPDKPNPGSLGERLNANAIAIVYGNRNATNLNIAGRWLSQNRKKLAPAATPEGRDQLFQEFVNGPLTNPDGETKTRFL